MWNFAVMRYDDEDYDDDDDDANNGIDETNKVAVFKPLFEQGFLQLSRLTEELTELKMAAILSPPKPGNVNMANLLAETNVDIDDLLAKVELSRQSLQIVEKKLLDNYVDEEIATEIVTILDNMLVMARVIRDASTRYNAAKQKIIETN